MLLARIYESAPLACRHCGADMRIIAFVTDSVSVRRVQAHISERVASPNVRYPYGAVAGLTRYEGPVLGGKLTFAATVQPPDVLVSLSTIPKPLTLRIGHRAEFR